jgi:hypothetical protein
MECNSYPCWAGRSYFGNDTKEKFKTADEESNWFAAIEWDGTAGGLRRAETEVAEIYAYEKDNPIHSDALAYAWYALAYEHDPNKRQFIVEESLNSNRA